MAYHAPMPIKKPKKINMAAETLIPLYSKKSRGEDLRDSGVKVRLGSRGVRVFDAAHLLAIVLGVEVSRASVYRWAKDGYPLCRGGTRVQLATCYVGGASHTSSEAVSAFLKTISKGEV